MMERQRFDNISLWSDVWRLVAFVVAVSLILFANHFGDGGMFSFLSIGLVRGIGILLLLMLAIVSHVGTVLESDGTFLYIVEIYYFKELTFPMIKIEDITKMVFVGDRVVSVFIQYGDKQYFLKVKKGDKAYKYLQGLANMRGLNQQDELIVKEVKRELFSRRMNKIIFVLIIAMLLWYYRIEILFCIVALGMFFS